MWSKGHSPGIEDREIQSAVKTYNMMDSGFSINTDEISKYETELINMVKNKINSKQQENQMKMQQRMKQ